MKKKILIFGGSGLVGSVFIESSKDLFEIISIYNTNSHQIHNVISKKIDFLNERQKISSIIENQKPDVIINTVAYPSVDFCEFNHNLTDQLHVDVVKDIVSTASRINCKVIFLSTDAVFDGKINKKYTEEDVPEPVNYYGLSKLKAEQLVLENPHNVVLRTAVIYGWHEKSRFTNWILGYLKENKKVDPFIDQFNTPTLVDDLVKSMIKIIELDVSGLFHATGKTCINRFDFAKKLAISFGYDEKLVIPVTSKQKKQDAPRPKSTCLDSSKLENLINFQFMDIDHGISFILDKSRDV
ncbi:Spore coat polysaccharide biosynthesis protein SpsK [Marine Group I thaumarchaeote SCGC AAA799-B03]|uniref:Spore coat polysaccharide biosynthesis protein SpsK n=1 Tax=Marine Group I thaumarchaeote SCGC AAA799-B03 TaxID=1502289 RepID=A0A087S8U7_9ARCH|nr:Spore coat polysaccharide biosynthesis protein SpsK [Marine Group I thaumarchaeote SCGC AAA799-B03]